MQVLRELVQIITRIKLRSIRKLGFPFNSDTQLGEMYELLADDVEDEELARTLTTQSSKSGTFRRLKSDLIDRLIASLFLVDLSLPSYNSRQQAYYVIHKNWAASKILFGKNARMAAVELAEQTLRQALRYEFNDLAFDLSRNLKLHFGTVAGNYTKYQEYAQECNRLRKVLEAEIMAEDNYTRFISEFVRQKAAASIIVEEAQKAHLPLCPYTDKFDSYTLHLYAGLLEMGIYTAASDYDAADTVCDKLIAFFEQKEYEASVPLQIAYYQKLLCHFQLGKFAQTTDFVMRGLELLQEGSYNWFKFQETYLVLALHTRQFSTAYRVFCEATGHARFKAQQEEIQEYWRILEAYLYFLYTLEELPEAAEDKRFTKFRIGRFLNQIPIFSRDKRGVNVSILIIQILLLVSQKRYHDTFAKIDAVEQYSRRHLFTKDTLRSFYFLKALLELPKNSFHKAAVKRKAAKHLEKMKAHPLEEAGQASFLTEIIPFELLWEYIVSLLDNDFH